MWESRSAKLFVLLAGEPFFFRHRVLMFLFERPKRNRKSRHRSGSVDDGLGALPPTPPPPMKSQLSRPALLPALPCRPGDTVLPRPVGCWRFCCAGAKENALFFGKSSASSCSVLYLAGKFCFCYQLYRWQGGTLPSARKVGPRAEVGEMADR